jgi:hypothetical protein
MIEYNLQGEEHTEDEILFIANNNGYKMFANKINPNEFLDKFYGDDAYLPFDPFSIMNSDEFANVISQMIDYFVEEEHYEKCAFLRDYRYTEYYIDFRFYDKVLGNHIDPTSGERNF